MSNNYPIQHETTILSAVTLTNAYTGNVSADLLVEGMVAINLLVSYTTGSGETNNTLQVKLDFPDADSNDHQYTNQTASTGTTTVVQNEFSCTDNTGGGTTKLYNIGPININNKKLKISVKETGVASNAGICTLKLVVGGK